MLLNSAGLTRECFTSEVESTHGAKQTCSLSGEFEIQGRRKGITERLQNLSHEHCFELIRFFVIFLLLYPVAYFSFR